MWRAKDLQQNPTWRKPSIFGYTMQTYVFYNGKAALLAWWEKCFVMNGYYDEVWCVPSATHVLRTYSCQNKVFNIGVYVTFPHFFCKFFVFRDVYITEIRIYNFVAVNMTGPYISSCYLFRYSRDKVSLCLRIISGLRPRINKICTFLDLRCVNR